jgi:hypothetical protein
LHGYRMSGLTHEPLYELEVRVTELLEIPKRRVAASISMSATVSPATMAASNGGSPTWPLAAITSVSPTKTPCSPSASAPQKVGDGLLMQSADQARQLIHPTRSGHLINQQVVGTAHSVPLEAIPARSPRAGFSGPGRPVPEKGAPGHRSLRRVSGRLQRVHIPGRRRLAGVPA